MSPEAQRIAIAEACGKLDRDCLDLVRKDRERVIANVGTLEWMEVADYPNDLNAMHEAAKTLNAFQWEFYREELAEVCTPLSQCRSKEQQFKFAMEATAAQRAEAFLRTIGKWEG